MDAVKEALLEQKIDNLGSRLEDFDARVDSRFAQVDSRFAQVDSRFAQVDARLDRFETEVDARFNRVEERIAEAGRQNFDEHSEMRGDLREIRAELHGLNRTLTIGLFSLVASVLGASVAAMVSGSI